MKNFQACALWLLFLCSAVSPANGRADDILSPVYRAITEKALPGISDFINPLTLNETDDFSDYWFLERVQCAYLRWVNQVNQAIANRHQLHSDGRLTGDVNYLEAIVSEHCSDIPQDKGTIVSKHPSLPLLVTSAPFFPIKRFVSEAGGLFSGLSSFVQKMPSYQALTLTGFQKTSDIRRRIILETLLFVLGRAVIYEPDSSWSKFFTQQFRTVMSQFHCSRFIKTDDPDLTPFNDCLSKQSDADVQRSNQATVLADIASGTFLAPNRVLHGFDAYGYQPGFAFAGDNASFQTRKSFTTGFSVIVETITLIAFWRSAFLR